MEITVKVKPSSKVIKIIPVQDNLVVCLTAPAKNNKANLQLVKILASYYKVKPSQVIIDKGLTSRVKKVLILK